MSLASNRLAIGFSCIGHTFSHLFAPIFFVVVLALEDEWGLSHGEAVALIVVGNVLFGVAAPVAGWLGDRWSSAGMMGMFFLGTGGGMLAVGMADGPLTVTLSLAVTGLFGSIYHPVGISWLIRNAERRGLVLGINGIFGGVGPAVAALSAGLLTDLWGWRAAFLVPGGLMVTIGVVFYLLMARGLIADSGADLQTGPPTSKSDRIRAFLVLLVTMLCTGLIYQASQAGLPKVFSERITGLGDGGGVAGIGMTVAMVYLVAGGFQVVAGYLADRYPLKAVYLATFLLQVPMLFLAAQLGGSALIATAMIMVTLNIGSLPAENALIARFAPSGWQGLVFGLKFIVAFGLSGLGVKMEGALYDATGGFFWLFVVLSAIAMVGAAAGLLLPPGRARAAAAPVK